MSLIGEASPSTHNSQLSAGISTLHGFVLALQHISSNPPEPLMSIQMKESSQTLDVSEQSW